jgi:hypothetical protein
MRVLKAAFMGSTRETSMETLVMGIEGLRPNPLRTLLSTLGVVIGVGGIPCASPTLQVLFSAARRLDGLPSTPSGMTRLKQRTGTQGGPRKIGSQ